MQHRLLPLVVTIAASLAIVSVAPASTSHEGWPPRTGKLLMNKGDASRPLNGTGRNDELLGGHGSDSIHGNGGRDVIWGDYKSSGQPDTQVDTLDGGGGADFIYASHGTNYISGGAGNDWIKAHFGHGVINCGPGYDTLYISRRAQSGYQIQNCERISHKTLGY